MLGEGFPSVLRWSCYVFLYMAEGTACPLASVYKVTVVILTWNIASDSSEGGTIERTLHEGGDVIMCPSLDQLTLTGLGRSGA